MAADAARGAGARDPAARRGDRRRRCGRSCPPEASTQNPVDMIASAASPEHTCETLEAVLADPAIDAVIVTSVPPVLFDPTELMMQDHRGHAPVAEDRSSRCSWRPRSSTTPSTASTVTRRSTGSPRAPCARSRAWDATPSGSGARSTPCPEIADVDDAAVEQLARPRRAGSIPDGVRQRPRGVPASRRAAARRRRPSPKPSRRRARSASRASSRRRGAGSSTRATSAASSSGIRDEAGSSRPPARSARASKPPAAARTSRASSCSGSSRPAARSSSVRSAIHESGPIIGFGLGGEYVEALRDVAFRLLPLSRLGGARADRRDPRGEDPRGAARRAARRSRGARGRRPARSAQLVTRHPRIAELDLNPVIAYEDGRATTIADARIRVGTPAPTRSHDLAGAPSWRSPHGGLSLSAPSDDRKQKRMTRECRHRSRRSRRWRFR